MSGIELDITDQQEALELDLVQLQKTIEFVLSDGGVKSAGISIAVVDDETIKRLKKEYFDMDVATDVISFDLSEPDNESPDHMAYELECEIVVNSQKAQREALARKGDPHAELNLYIVHGLLHQLGYDDQDDTQFQRMHEKENQLLSELGFGSVFGPVR